MRTLNTRIPGRMVFASAMLASAIIALGTARLDAAPLGTAFIYQGRLTDGGAGANGSYAFRFVVYDDAAAGNSIGNILTNPAVAVKNGLFTVTLDFGPAVFTGNARWLDLGVRSNGSAAPFQSLTPRQPVTPTSYALYTPSAGTAAIASAVSPGVVSSAGLQDGAVTAAKVAGGQVVKSLNGLADSVTLAAGTNTIVTKNGNTLTIAGSSDWKLGGNAGTVAGTNFIGTTDYQPLDFKVYNLRGLRLEPTSSEDTVNVIGGSSRNFVGAGVGGATIGGGGTGEYQGGAYANQVGANFGTVSGGALNTIETNAEFGTIGGGAGNLIQTNAYFAAIPGGVNNRAASYSFAAGSRSKAVHSGSFVWADPTPADFATTGSNQFLIRATGGIGVNKPNPATALDVNGTISATHFSGNGAGLTNVNAANLVGNISTPGTIANSATTVTPANVPNSIVGRDAAGKFSATGMHWSSSAELTDDQGGSLELGDSARAFGVPYIDFHHGVSGNEDYNVRLINDTDGQLTVVGGFRSDSGVVVDHAGQNSGAVANSSLTFGPSSGEGIASKRTSGGNQYGLDFYTAFQNRMTILNNGNVGLGTLTPTASLEVRGINTAGPSLRLTGVGGLGSKVGIDLATYDAPLVGASNIAARIEASDTNWSASIDFQTKAPGGPAGALTSRLYIQNGGNVGIGTTSPATALDVNGTVTATRLRATGAEPATNVIPVGGMIWINPGTFIMGSRTDELGHIPGAADEPQTVVTLTKGFWMGAHEVTQGEYLKVVSSNPSGFLGDTNRPVEQVTWYNATNYCGLLTTAERATGQIPSSWWYRLPTEAEWEYACRAGARTTRFGFGDDLSTTALTNYAWFAGNSGITTHPVEQKLPNPWGLRDMHGNVLEWCQDSYYTYSGGSVSDPRGPVTAFDRVARGGSLSYPAFACRSAQRHFPRPDFVSLDVGFRVVLSPTPP